MELVKLYVVDFIHFTGPLLTTFIEPTLLLVDEPTDPVAICETVKVTLGYIILGPILCVRSLICSLVRARAECCVLPRVVVFNQLRQVCDPVISLVGILVKGDEMSKRPARLALTPAPAQVYRL